VDSADHFLVLADETIDISSVGKFSIDVSYVY